MRLPNSYGSVYKLSGKRRNPWVARKTVGWKDNPETMQTQPMYQFIGYYPTKAEALNALSEYNRGPYDLSIKSLTFDDVYEKWSDVHFEKVSRSNVLGYQAAYKLCDPIKKMNIADIKLIHLQNIVDTSGKNTPTLRKLKVLFGLVYDYAVMHEIVTHDKREMVRYVDIKGAGNPNGYERKPFSKSEIKMLWDNANLNESMQIPLILIYTGIRIGEFMNLKSEDVSIAERYFYVRQSKTESGIRQVPIAEKVVPFFEYWLNKNNEYIFTNTIGKKLIDRTFRDSYWSQVMDFLGMEHKPHDTRHTCISLLTEKGVDERIIKKIVGHKGQGVTQAVYTHLDLDIKLEAINKI